MGVIVGALALDTHHLQHILRPCPGLLGGDVGVQLNHLLNLVAHGFHRIQRGHGVLEDHGNLLTPDVPHLLGGELQEITSLIEDLAACDLRRGIRQNPHDAEGCGGFTGAGLAHQAQGLAHGDVQVQPVDSFHSAAAGAVLYPKVMYLQKVFLVLFQSPDGILVLHLKYLLSHAAWDPVHPAGHRPAHSG